MTAEEYRDTMSLLELDHVAIALMFEVDPSVSRRWADGHSPVPREVEVKLENMRAEKLRD